MMKHKNTSKEPLLKRSANNQTKVITVDKFRVTYNPLTKRVIIRPFDENRKSYTVTLTVYKGKDDPDETIETISVLTGKAKIPQAGMTLKSKFRDENGIIWIIKSVR